MERLYSTGMPVVVRGSPDRTFLAQVMFVHYGNPRRLFVAWLGDAPDGSHPVADWVDAEFVELIDGSGAA